MLVSVIIPVYNAASYIEEAVRSALMQPETIEIILVEDGSPDESLNKCIELNNRYKNVQLFRHANGSNRGASASRNLGIRVAKAPYIAFLDADDFYLDNRFTETIKIFKNNKEIDGVYGATGTTFTDKQLAANWQCAKKPRVTYISKPILPDKLFHTLLFGANGAFHTNAITVKKSLLKKTEAFNENLSLHQDTDMWLKMALMGKLVKTQNDAPIAVRRVHYDNRITKISNMDFSTRFKLFKAFHEWTKTKKLPHTIIEQIEYKMWKNELFLFDAWTISKKTSKTKSLLFRSLNPGFFFLKRVINQPDLIINKFIFKFMIDYLITKTSKLKWYTLSGHLAKTPPNKKRGFPEHQA
ncbi:glycosyltransferase family 2 protein [Desulfoluna spongiiphila]|uniref:Glycosyl transferase family 2 n=1 Tax=Desulfoluna spongiiphila TaxID=419481 RepID=A0A1G5JNC1_9BACT|nr:glycosyltransferase family 2 protein [Desulfoluna spongiiphila]SCY89922.1 Glycosyl transferase family 2 [Desulfoluna spongiiphila]